MKTEFLNLNSLLHEWKKLDYTEEQKLCRVAHVVGVASLIKRDVDTFKISKEEGYSQLLEALGLQ